MRAKEDKAVKNSIESIQGIYTEVEYIDLYQKLTELGTFMSNTFMAMKYESFTDREYLVPEYVFWGSDRSNPKKTKSHLLKIYLFEDAPIDKVFLVCVDVTPDELLYAINKIFVEGQGVVHSVQVCRKGKRPQAYIQEKSYWHH